MHQNNISGLNAMFDRSPDKRRPLRKGTAVVAFILLSMLSGLILTAFAAPVALPVDKARESFANYWEALPTELPDMPPPQRSVILDVNGNKMAEFFAENRILVSLDQVSPYVTQALVATEDRSFYTHGGVDWKGITRALVNNAQGDSLQGASTITQQLVKNTLVVNAKTRLEILEATETSPYRKIEEIRYSRALEEKYTKDEIMEKYLNVVLYSNGVYGIGTASSYYFNKPASDLTLPEAALLVGLLKNPTGYDPIKFPEKALERRNIVLGAMKANKDISQEEYDAAVASPLTLQVTPPVNGCAVAPDPYYCQLVLNSINSDPALGETETDRADLLYRGGLTIQTYYDPTIHSQIQSTVDEALGRGNRVATGVAVVEPGTGVVKAIAQNRTWGDESQSVEGDLKTQVIYPDRVAFQSGSTFKVFTLAAALEAGFPLNAIIDAPSVYNPGYMNVPQGGITNLSSSGAGPMSVYTGTARSSNTFYASLAEQVGVLNVAEMAESLGLDVPREGPVAVGAKDASFTLGTISVSPLQMAAAYATFASGGIYCEPHYVSSITGPTGEEIPVSDGNCRRAVSAQTAANVSDILQGVVDGPDDLRTGKDASIGRPVAGKTGTTNQQAAVWFAGYTPQLATAVWVGDPRGGQKYPLSQGLRFYGRWTNNVWGSTISAPIWKSVMLKTHESLPVQGFPPAAGEGVGNTLPDVRGMEVQAAVSILMQRGYKVTIAEGNAPADEFSTPDHVANQDPLPQGAKGSKNANITLTLTHGSKKWQLEE